MNRVILINTLTVKAERIDEFVAAQREFSSAMRGRANGLLGGRLYRSTDGRKAVLVSHFESPEAQQAMLRSPEFQAHLTRMREMVESSSPSNYVEAYSHGDFQ